MYIVEYNSPYSNELVTKKFRSRNTGASRSNAHEKAFSYAKRQYEDFYTEVSVRGYETIAGKKTGRGFTFRGADNFFMFTG